MPEQSDPARTTNGSLGAGMARGAFWTVSMQLGLNMVGLFSNLVMARLLTPDDFGVIALTTAVSSLFELMSQFGLHNVLIREKSVDRSLLDSAWTISAVRGCLLAIVMIVMASPFARWMNEPRVQNVMYCYAVGFAIVSFMNMGLVQYKIALEFDKIFKVNFYSRLLGAVAGVAMAVWLRNYWAFAIAMIVQSIAGTLLSYRVHPFRPRFSLARVRAIMGFSLWLLLNNILTSLILRGDNFIIRKFATSAVLGGYSLANDIGGITTTRLMRALTQVLFPGLAQLRRENSHLGRGFFLGSSTIFAVLLPAGAGVSLVADDLVRGLLGDQWLSMIPLLRAIALIYTLRLSYAGADSLLVTEGRVNLLSLRSAIVLVCRLGVAFYGVMRIGVMGAVWGLLAGEVASAVFAFIVINPSLRGYRRPMLGAALRTMSAAAMMVFVVIGLQHLRGGSVTTVEAVWGLALDTACGALTYVGGLLGLWRLAGRPDGPEPRLLELISGFLRSRGKKIPGQ